MCNSHLYSHYLYHAYENTFQYQEKFSNLNLSESNQCELKLLVRIVFSYMYNTLEPRYKEVRYNHTLL